MAWGLNIRYLVYVLLMILNLSPWVSGQQVPCHFIFGASLFDNGNNNDLLTLAKANFKPYGADFREGPTGRFTNGRNMADILSERLGFKNYIPSFTTTKGKKDILTGVNYASGGSGIRNETGSRQGFGISMDGQLKNHQTTISSMIKILGNNQKATDYLHKCIYSISMGDNDYYNYFSPLLYNSSKEYNPNQYATLLIQIYGKQLQTLYDYGARKVALFGVPPIGCTPRELAKSGQKSCVESVNNAVQLFNTRLRSLVHRMNTNLKYAKFISVNLYGIILSSFRSFKVTDTSCCKTAAGLSLVLCLPLTTPCGTRNEYLWWDALHPTEASNVITVGRAYKAQSPSDTFPIDIGRLALL